MVLVPAENCVPELILLFTVGVEQLSVAVGAVHVAAIELVVELGKAKVILDGQLVRVGAVISVVQLLNGCTITKNEQVEVLPATSLAV
jgi:hypothetical protein